MDRYDIVIGGGSFAGMALAASLARSLSERLRIAVIDPAPVGTARTADQGRASALSASSKQLLEAIGAWAALDAHAQPMVEIDITDTSLEAAARLPVLTYENALPEGGWASWMIENGHLRAALESTVQALPGIARIEDEIASLGLEASGAAVRLRSGRSVSASLVVAADGRASPLREMAGIRCLRWGAGQVGIVTIVAHDKPHHGRAVQHFLPAGPFAILPLPATADAPHRSCVTWSEEARAARAIMALDDTRFLSELERRFGTRLGALRLAAPRSAHPLDMHLARDFIATRMALVADAAHGLHPIAGQGLNIGLRDVAALTETVADGVRLGLDPGDATILERYQRWRRLDTVLSAAAMDGLNRLFSNDWTLVRLARSAGAGLIDRMPGAKRLLVRQAAGLTGEVPRLLRGELA